MIEYAYKNFRSNNLKMVSRQYGSDSKILDSANLNNSPRHPITTGYHPDRKSKQLINYNS